MTQWGQQPARGQWAQPNQQWGAPRPQQQWGAQQTWNAPQQTQQWGAQPRYSPNQAPNRGGGASPLKWMIIAIFAILAGILLLGLLNDTGSSGGGQNQPPGEYQNENYQVPQIDTAPGEFPIPTTYGEATDWLQNNSIYNVSIPTPTRCESQPINLDEASNAQLEAHFNELTACLMRVFDPPMQQAGYALPRPSVTIYSSPINTRCGDMPMYNAAYCAGDQQIYYASNLPDVIPSELQGVQYAVESVVAHEFAHHIQARTGILISSAAWEQNSNEAAANNFARRLEVQADCLAGMFIQSAGPSVGIDENGSNQISLLFYAIGDDVLTGDPNIDGNHGHGDSRRNWYWQGYTNTSTGACNTYVAPDAEVR